MLSNRTFYPRSNWNRFTLKNNRIFFFKLQFVPITLSTFSPCQLSFLLSIEFLFSLSNNLILQLIIQDNFLILHCSVPCTELMIFFFSNSKIDGFFSFSSFPVVSSFVYPPPNAFIYSFRSALCPAHSVPCSGSLTYKGHIPRGSLNLQRSYCEKSAAGGQRKDREVSEAGPILLPEGSPRVGSASTRGQSSCQAGLSL